MIELKVVISVALVWLALKVPNVIDSTLEGVVLFASVLVSLGVLWSAAKKLTGHARRWSKGIDHMLELPVWMEKTDRRLERIERKAQSDLTVTHRVEQDPPA